MCSEIFKSFISLLWPELLPTSILCPLNSGSKVFFYDKFLSRSVLAGPYLKAQGNDT